MTDLWIEREGRKEWGSCEDMQQGHVAMSLHEDCLCLLDERKGLRARVARLEGALKEYVSDCDHMSQEHFEITFSELLAESDKAT